MKVITMDVGPGGEQVETTTEGFKGGECRKASAPFEKIIGGKVVSDEPTAEMQQGAGDFVGEAAR